MADTDKTGQDVTLPHNGYLLSIISKIRGITIIYLDTWINLRFKMAIYLNSNITDIRNKLKETKN